MHVALVPCGPNPSDLTLVALRAAKPPVCRYISREEMRERMEKETNKRLVKADHAPMIEEELIAGRLYTGPMYM